MQTHLGQDETELLELTKSVVNKISSIGDDDYGRIISGLVANFE